jgi:SAM-dependent methyltransferase
MAFANGRGWFRVRRDGEAGEESAPAPVTDDGCGWFPTSDLSRRRLARHPGTRNPLEVRKREARVENVEFLEGTIEDVPLPDDSIDVVISNCVINLSGDKPAMFREAARVLRPGGRFAVSDVIADPDMDDTTRRDMQQWTGCIAGALTRETFVDGLIAAGFDDVEVQETHRVHQHASSAIIRARLRSA